MGFPQKDATALFYPKIRAHTLELETNSNATYAIISVADAWAKVKEGSGVVSSVIPKSTSPFEKYQPAKVDKILINEVYLAYYDNPGLQKYVQPIYVFDGNYTSTGGEGDITIYFPAVSGQHIKQPKVTE